MADLLARYRQLLQNPNVRRTLDTISYAEGTSGPEGYRTMFGGGKFDTSGGWRHPDRVVHGGGYSSAAAGKYQFMPDTWTGVSQRLGLKDFSPESQDLGALAKIEERGVNLEEIAKGGLKAGHIHKLAPEWASLPTAQGKSYYGQPVKGLGELQKVYGGQIGAGGGGGSTASSGGGTSSGSSSGTSSSSSGASGGDGIIQPEPITPPKPITPAAIQTPGATLIKPAASFGVGPNAWEGAGGQDATPSGNRLAGSRSIVRQLMQMLMGA
jgi:muramidase (phage lysozyme)